MTKKHLLTIVFTLFAIPLFTQQMSDPGIDDYVDYLETNTFQSPKDYMQKAFEENDIVILSERYHHELTQYELIVNMIKDHAFTGDIYTEVGCFNAGKQINEFLAKENLTHEEIEYSLLKIIRNYDYSALWPNYNYYFLLKSVYEINQTRSTSNKIFIHPLDIRFDWNSVNTKESYTMLMEMMRSQERFPPLINRNIIMGQHFIRAYDHASDKNPKKKKALVIMNTYHAFPRIPKSTFYPNRPYIYSTGEYISKTFPNSTKCVLINGIGNAGNLFAGGKWDAAFQIYENKSVGFDISNTPFGNTTFDMYNFGGEYKKAKYADIVDGFIFYRSIEDQKFSVGIPGVFSDSAFVDEFYRRSSFENNITLDDAKASPEINTCIANWNAVKNVELEQIQEIKAQINKWIEAYNR